MQSPHYNSKPFGSVCALARRLSISEHQLIYVAAEADSYYYPNPPELKSDGTFRQHYRVAEPLKRIQKTINKSIFLKTKFPPYLLGGIRDPKHRRDYVVDAKIHAGRRFLIQEDIKNFFPSVCADLVRRMWQHLYHLPPGVANLLTKLTTYKGILPQGAPTSTYIGNLILWDDEPQVVAILESWGFRYTRYIDNFAFSSNRVYTRPQIRDVTELIYGMLYRHGLRPNRRKRVIATRRKPQIQHGLALNSGRPTLCRERRRQIRSAIQNFQRDKTDLPPETRQQKYRSLVGMASMVQRFHSNPGRRMLQGVEP